MLSRHDDYPIHQTPEPIARPASTDRHVYDRYWFNGYSGDGDFRLGADGCLMRRGAGETAPYVFTGVSIAHPRMFDDAPRGRFSLNIVWDRAIASGRLHGLVLDGWWMHVGTPPALVDAERFIAELNAPIE